MSIKRNHQFWPFVLAYWPVFTAVFIGAVIYGIVITKQEAQAGDIELNRQHIEGLDEKYDKKFTQDHDLLLKTSQRVDDIAGYLNVPKRKHE